MIRSGKIIRAAVLRTAALLLFFLPHLLRAQSYAPLVFDSRFSQYTGSCNLLFLHKVAYGFEDRYIRDTLCSENTGLKKAAGIGYRMVKLFLLDAQVDGIIALAQHEVFGHGARFRELGFKRNFYNLNLFPPFGDGSGTASWGTLQQGYFYPTAEEMISVATGGVEGEMQLANELSCRMLLDDSIHYRQGLLYAIAQNNLSLYLWYTRYLKPENIRAGNDMVNYTDEMNYLYRLSSASGYNLEKLSVQSLLSCANPLQIYAAAAVVYTYGIKGRKTMKIPMIRLGRLRYLPAFNYSLTPFGSRYHFVNYLRSGRMLFSADFQLGDPAFNRFYGLSLKGFNIIDNKRISAAFHLDGWVQPELELVVSHYPPRTEMKAGGAIKADLSLRPFVRENRVGLFVQAGYKTKGFLAGEPLDRSLLLRYGISMKL